ncbi:MAG: hypothetical protein HQM12_23420 [SAR324 cluster bacterium]|nr:hypothetical protein [SAR324 cluster bacterium]
MRVTETTKRENVLGNIQKNSQRLKTLHTDLSSGQKINRTSDDPIGATVAQDIVTSISRREQLQHNMEDNLVWLESNEVELQHMTELLNHAKQLILSEASGTASSDSRAVTAQEIRDISNALMDAGNVRHNKLFLFSGTKTLTKPLTTRNPIQPAKIMTDEIVQKDVAELLDIGQFRAQFEGHSLNDYRVKITKPGALGFARYKVSDDAGVTWSKERILTPVIKVHNTEGKPNDQVILRFSDEQGLLGDLIADQADFTKENFFFDIEDQGAIFPEGIEFVFQPNRPVDYVGNQQKKEVLISDGIAIPLNITAEEILLKTDDKSLDIFQVLYSLEQSLIKNDPEALALKLEDLDRSLDQVLRKQAQIGNTMIDIQKSSQKMDEEVFSTQKRLSDVQDVDIAESAIDLNTAERNNKVSLDVGGRLLQPSLMQFLR